MGKKGTKKRTKWQALPMEEANGGAAGAANGADTTTNAAVAVGFKKFRDFSTYNGDNSYKTAVLGPQRGYNNNNHHYSARQHTTNGYENGGLPAGGGENNRAATNGSSGYLTEKDQNCQASSEYGGVKSTTTTTTASSVNGHGGGGGYYNNHRYNRDYPTATGRHHFSSSSAAAYKSRYQTNQATTYNHYPSRDSNSAHSSYSASHHKNSGASSTTSSTTSSSYRNGYENSWRSSRNGHYNNNRPPSHYYGFNKENSGYASNKGAPGNDEYTRITTPRQDVLFKKGYLSRPKRISAMEEGYLGTPLISQVPTQGDPNVLLPPGDNLPTADVDQQQQQINEDNSPLYFCPGFVDHNGFFHANPTFMPNSYDQFGQPIVMMPYGPPPVQAQPVPLDGPVPFETTTTASDNATTGEEDENEPLQNEVDVVNADEMAVVDSEIVSQPQSEGTQEDIKPEEMFVESVSPVSMTQPPIMESEQLELQTIEPTNEAISPLPIEVDPHEVPLGDESSAAPECPPEMSTVEVIEGEPVNTPLPLDPASNSFYPQSSMYPYYPMVFTPQQLPPNTSIIPLADLYYNENYAGLAAEIFGLTEQPSIQSDDSAAVPPCDDSDEDQLSAGIVVATVDGGEPVAVDDAVLLVDGNNAVAADEKRNESSDGAIAEQIIMPQSITIADPQESPEASIQLATPVPPSSPIVQIENAAELVANSNLKVDVEEFHPRIPIAEPTVITAPTTLPNHKPYRTSTTAQYYNHHHHHQDQYAARRRQDDRQDDYRRRKYGENQNGGPNNNRLPRKIFNNPSSAAPVATVTQKDEEKKPERTPVQNDKQVTPPPSQIAQKTTPKSANKTPNSKRAIQESIKHIEEQNIDLSRTSIAAVQSSNANADSNQWLVKTKGKKKRAAAPIDFPEEDMFENEEEIATAVIVAPTPVVEPTPEVVIRASTPLIEVEEVVEKTSEKATKDPKTPPNKQKKSPNGKSSSPATNKSNKGKNSGNKKSKTPNGKGTNANGAKGFEVIEPDFGVITRLKTEPISLDPDLEEELEHILNMKDIEEDFLARPLPVEEDLVFRKSTSLPKSPRSEKDNIIDLDDLEALERSLMDFDLSGELKERMIEIIQSELEAPLGGAEEEEELVEVAKEEDFVLVVKSTEGSQEENLEVITPEEPEIEQEVVVESVEVEVSVEKQGETHQEEQEEDEAVTVTEIQEVVQEEEVIQEEEVEKDEELIDPVPIPADDDQLEQTELKIITSDSHVDEHCTGSSSSSSSLSSPIPTDDGRDGSNSESDDVMTPPPINEEEQEKKMVLPSQLEGRLFPREPLEDNDDPGTHTKESSIASDATEVPDIGITASVSKWLEEKEKECSPDPIFRIPDDPQVAKLIFKAMYGVDLALDVDGDEEEFETEDDMDSLSADESDYEPDSRDALKDLLSGRGQSGGGGKRDNQVPIDTDSDYMSDGQNIKPADVQSAGGLVNGKLSNNKSSSAAAAVDGTTTRADSRRVNRSKMCKVM